MAMLFRWSIWGDKRFLAETLPYSVGTFRRAFGESARYIVYTDEPAEIRELLLGTAEIRSYSSYGDCGTVLFDVDAKATWRKWCPTPRLDPASTEFYVDGDVFLVGDPTEVRGFSTGASGRTLLAFREAPTTPHKIGRFAPRILAGIPPVNTGFLGQRAGTDITNDLLMEFRWWEDHVPVRERDFHDDQGAVTAILARHYLIGQVDLLPQDRYCIISPASNSERTTLDGVVAFHATYPNHPAFHRFRRTIADFMSQTDNSSIPSA